MRGKTRERDGVYQRADRPGWWISFTNAKGQRRRRKVAGAHTMQQARAALASELQNVERARIFGAAPPSPEAFQVISKRYLNHQKARLTSAAYERTRGVVEGKLKDFFGTMKISEIRRGDVQRYITKRCGDVTAGTVARELNILKRLFSLCVEWELLPFNPSSGRKSSARGTRASPLSSGGRVPRAARKVPWVAPTRRRARSGNRDAARRNTGASLARCGPARRKNPPTPDEERRRPDRLFERTGVAGSKRTDYGRSQLDGARVFRFKRRTGFNGIQKGGEGGENRGFSFPRSPAHGRVMAPNAGRGYSHSGAIAGA